MKTFALALVGVLLLLSAGPGHRYGHHHRNLPAGCVLAEPRSASPCVPPGPIPHQPG